MIHGHIALNIYDVLWQVERVVIEAGTAKINELIRLEARWMKVNTDASVDDQGRVGLGAVLRDYNGNVKAAMIDTGTGQMDIFHAECMALQEGLRWMRRFGSTHIIIESDGSQVVGLSSQLERSDLKQVLL